MSPNTGALRESTYLPDENANSAELLDFIAAHQDKHGYTPPRGYFLTNPDDNSQISIPEEVMRVLIQVTEAMALGRAVTVTPQNMTLTTQQAADLLGISRPTVVKLIDSGELPAEVPGSRRRRLQLTDVLNYRETKRRREFEAIMSTSDLDIDQETTPEEAQAILRSIRKQRSNSPQ